MKKILSVSIILILTIFCLNYSVAQNGMINLDDVQNSKYYPTRIYDLKFMASSDSYSFTKDGKSLWVAKGKDTPKEILKISEITPAPNNLIGIKYISSNIFSYTTKDALYQFDIAKKTSTKVNTINPKGTFTEIDYVSNNIAYKKDNNIWVNINNSDKQITNDGSKDIVYAEAAHRNEFGIDKGLFWSPNGNVLAFYRIDQSMVTDYPIVNTTTRIAEASPIKYPMAGMKSHEVLIGVYNTKTNSTVYLKTRKNESLEEREMYLTNITFSPDEKTIFLQKLNRLQNHLWLESYDANTGELLKVLLDEVSAKFVEPEAGIYFIPNNPSQFIYLSERDNWNHMYLYDINGKMIKQLTKGDWMVKSIEGFNAKSDEVFFYSTKDSPIDNNFYGVNIKTGKLTRYTPNDGTHNVAFNYNGTLFLDTYSNYTNTPNTSILLDKKGNTITTLHNSNNPWKDLEMPKIEIGTIKAKDNTELYYRMIKPHNFDPNKKYPVLVYVYGGPHAQLITNNWLGGSNNFFLFLAQQGYIVWTVDSRGSANRGYEFESAIWHNLGTIEVSDQMDGVNYLKSLPYIDANRIGVDGWSYGGFMTISMKLKNPGIFKTATAGGPVIDWKWYEVMYGERYMGTPENNPNGYKEASLINHINKLQGKLMLIQGDQDPTVLPQNSIEFLRQCITNKKQVDFFLYPQHEHNVRGGDRIHLYRKIYEYHRDNL
ncbi:MAG: family peptidase [Bacteroidetes bacterium]|nr:family peptidase [Bacteroidota bacterium]